MYEILVRHPRPQVPGNRLTTIQELRIQPHVDAVLEVELRIVAKGDMPPPKIEVALPAEGFDRERRVLRHDWLFEDGKPAPAQGVLEKFHRRVEASAMSLAVEKDVPPNAAGNVLLIPQFRMRLRISFQPRPSGFAKADENGRPIRVAFSGRDDGKLRTGHFLQVTRQRFRRVVLDLARFRICHDLVGCVSGLGEREGLAATVRLCQRL